MRKIFFRRKLLVQCPQHVYCQTVRRQIMYSIHTLVPFADLQVHTHFSSVKVSFDNIIFHWTKHWFISVPRHRNNNDTFIEVGLFFHELLFTRQFECGVVHNPRHAIKLDQMVLMKK